MSGVQGSVLGTAALLAVGLVACTTARPTENPPPVGGECNVITDVCVLPFPSSRLTRPEPSSPTGFAVELSDAADFADHWATLSPRLHDGFSPASMISTWLPLGGDRDTLPPSYLASLEPDSTIQLVVADATSDRYGERWPFAAELVNSSETGANLLVITPLRALEPASRYAVVVTDALLTVSGTTPVANDTMASLLSGTRSTELPELWDYYRDLVRLVDAELGVDPAHVVQLWDFHTATRESITSDLDAIAAGTRAWIADEQPVATVDPPTSFEGHARFAFRFDVPKWHEDRDAPLHRDADGVPTPVGVLILEGVLLVPRTATPENPAVPILFGHALSATANQGASFMAELDLDAGPYAAASIDWDLHGRRGSGLPAIIGLAGGLNTPAFAAAMLQSAADTLVLTHVLRGLSDLPERGDVLRAAPVLFLGQSLGALVGGLAVVVNDDLDAAVLNVGGGSYSQILRDGEVIDIVGMREVIEARIEADPPEDLPNDIAYGLALVMSQLGLDAGDPLTFAHRLSSPRADGSARAPVLLQWSEKDGVVPNRATETYARTAGLALVTPSVQGVAGLAVAAAPTCGAPGGGLSQFSVSDSGFTAHLALSEEVVQEQVWRWFGSFVNDDPEDDGDIAYDATPCP